MAGTKRSKTPSTPTPTTTKKTKKPLSTTAPIPNKKKSKRSLTDIKALGNDLLTSRSHINNLPILLTYITPTTPPHYILESTLSLQSFFSPLLPSLPSSKPNTNNNNNNDVGDPEVIYKSWCRAKFDELVVLLVDVAVCPDCEDTIREVVLDALMEFVKLGNGGKFYSALYHKLIHAIVCSSLEVEFLLETLASTYFKYVDVRYFNFITTEKLCKVLESNLSSGDKVVEGDSSSISLERSIKKVHYILSQIPPLSNIDENAEIEIWSEGFLSKDSKDTEGECKQDKKEKSSKKGISMSSLSKKMKLKFTRAWMSFLGLPLSLEVYKEVLANLHHSVIPYLSNPLKLCDFLTRSYDIGGVVSVMALGGLFVLMTKYGLEYPNFYEKLYALLVPPTFMAKHRAKFFQLLDSCLKSPLLPAYLAAAFTKKLSRLSIEVPPSGALIIIALVHNLLRRHPSINCLVHQDISEETNQDETKVEDSKPASEKRGIDLFNDEEKDPLKANAMRSSLWEVDTLRHHYCPPVSRFVLSLENDLTVKAKTTEVPVSDFTSGSYATIFMEEMRRRVKQVPLAFYKATPTNLFSDTDFPGWTFNSGHLNEGVNA